jgi:hypothetical protein
MAMVGMLHSVASFNATWFTGKLVSTTKSGSRLPPNVCHNETRLPKTGGKKKKEKKKKEKKKKKKETTHLVRVGEGAANPLARDKVLAAGRGAAAREPLKLRPRVDEKYDAVLFHDAPTQPDQNKETIPPHVSSCLKTHLITSSAVCRLVAVCSRSMMCWSLCVPTMYGFMFGFHSPRCKRASG